MNSLDYPSFFDDEGAMEIDSSHRRFAWNEYDSVFIYTGTDEERDDGYVYIGDLKWEPRPDMSRDEELEYNERRLHEYAQEYLAKQP